MGEGMYKVFCVFSVNNTSILTAGYHTLFMGSLRSK